MISLPTSPPRNGEPRPIPILVIVFELIVQAEFAAAHAIRMGGRLEPLHGHNWRVRVTVAADRLDDDGLVCDFHLLQSHVHDAVGPLDNSTLNDIPPFDRVNPTAERVAQHIADRLSESLAGALPAGARVAAVEVTEAPGCAAFYRPGPNTATRGAAPR